ncbi:glycosyltransferase family 4 protein [Candidatus Mycolicibacterium alkanivorans]|uniref:Glycosyltransferase family 4 protein n=1 Tax=Candidatus Mycolicibacterium alkanivorans TaxID=2954114 RepID=A0ABS9YQ92_9MYCO|nr:glycosyltransferase family 4 protein [Candidatus Mycolicibacterium alkanivorans]MCI4673460.1 glycosyltransferase family 4 protein [Candidatus Mycolicibacterium alkanivorans]
MTFSGAGSPTRGRRVLILVENLPSPFDRRVWQEATTLQDHGWQVSIICPTGKGYEKSHEIIDRIHIYRYDLPAEGDGALGYLAEYSAALWHTFRLAFRVWRERGFDVVHACNPPDFLFVVGGFFKLFARTRFLFDHHDINPELYEAKFGRRGFFWRLMIWLERATFVTADVSIATNESYRRIAIERGGMDPQRVFVVRSGPMLDRLKIVPPKPELKRGRRFLVGYVGVMGKQEGIDLLLRAVRHIVFEMERHDVHFGLVGGGTSLAEMQELAVVLEVSEHVTFTGRVPDAELLDMLNTADVCVNPDVANEMNDKSTMNKIMEYMALGKPIVQFDLTEGRFSAGESSLYAAPNDAEDMARKIIELLDNPERRAQMGAFGRRRVANELAWQYEVPKLLRAYDEVMAVPGRKTYVSD